MRTRPLLSSDTAGAYVDAHGNSRRFVPPLGLFYIRAMTIVTYVHQPKRAEAQGAGTSSCACCGSHGATNCPMPGMLNIVACESAAGVNVSKLREIRSVGMPARTAASGPACIVLPVGLSRFLGHARSVLTAAPSPSRSLAAVTGRLMRLR
jgi:hypothetical protein